MHAVARLARGGVDDSAATPVGGAGGAVSIATPQEFTVGAADEFTHHGVSL